MLQAPPHRQAPVSYFKWRLSTASQGIAQPGERSGVRYSRPEQALLATTICRQLNHIKDNPIAAQTHDRYGCLQG